ncbi:MAG: 16S rRNA (adenine(1518)-N(6)/adenine(1519)-N(6))-dimethyltransferase RsmA [Candidatus Omnitrophota bacterium]
MKFKKSFGQNFLRDKDYIERIINSLSLDNEAVLEIGPGSGQMTRRLIKKCERLYCIEKDISLISLLRERFSSSGVSVIAGDIIDFDLASIGQPLVLFGNIPFNISNELIRYLVKNRGYLKKAYLTFQKEFARKLTAQPNTKEYGFLTCYVSYYASVTVLFDIPKEAFYPSPRVDASLVMIQFPLSPFFDAVDERLLFTVIKESFSSRRKKIKNCLERISDKESISKILKKTGINPDCRPENLSLQQYCNIAGSLPIRKE